MTSRSRTSARAIAALSVAAIALAMSGGWASGAGSKSEPQPELAKFRIAANGTNGGSAVLPDDTIVFGYEPNSGGVVKVCRIKPAARKCASTATLTGIRSGGSSDLVGQVVVLATGGHDVDVLVSDGNSSSDYTALYASTNDGASFGPEVKAGDLYSINSGAVVDGVLVLSGGDPHDGLEIQAMSPTGVPTSTSLANPNTDPDTTSDISVSNYKNGALVAVDNDANTSVYYAPDGTDFNATNSYHLAGSFKKVNVDGSSGPWLLLGKSSTLLGGFSLRRFNGHSFGSAHTVPELKHHDDTTARLDVDGAVVHVFYVDRRDSYDLLTDTTTNGKHWSGITALGTDSDGDGGPALGPFQSGLVFEGDFSTTHIEAQPVLNVQSVSATLSKTHVTVGHSTKLEGVVKPTVKGLKITLEKLSGKKWKNASSTTEKANGSYAFKIAGKTATYRVVAKDVPIFLQYGYSRNVTLTAKRKH